MFRCCLLQDLRRGVVTPGVTRTLRKLSSNIIKETYVLVHTRARWMELNKAAFDRLGCVHSEQYHTVCVGGTPESAESVFETHGYKVGMRVLSTFNDPPHLDPPRLFNGSLGVVTGWAASTYLPSEDKWADKCFSSWAVRHRHGILFPIVSFSHQDGSSFERIVTPRVLPTTDTVLGPNGDGITSVTDRAGNKPKVQMVGLPLEPAEAITIHKAAGLTIDAPVLIDFTGAASGVPALVYEALSRTCHLMQMQARAPSHPHQCVYLCACFA